MRPKGPSPIPCTLYNSKFPKPVPFPMYGSDARYLTKAPPTASDISRPRAPWSPPLRKGTRSTLGWPSLGARSARGWTGDRGVASAEGFRSMPRSRKHTRGAVSDVEPATSDRVVWRKLGAYRLWRRVESHDRQRHERVDRSIFTPVASMMAGILFWPRFHIFPSSSTVDEETIGSRGSMRFRTPGERARSCALVICQIGSSLPSVYVALPVRDSSCRDVQYRENRLGGHHQHSTMSFERASTLRRRICRKELTLEWSPGVCNVTVSGFEQGE